MIMVGQGSAVAKSGLIKKEKTEKLPNGLSMEGYIDQKLMPYRAIVRVIKKLAPPFKESIRVHRLRELESDRYALRKVLFVQIEKTEDRETFIAKIPWLDVYGLGPTEEQAVEDFQLSLIEDYELMKEEEDRLSDHLHNHLADLTTILREP